ncbi:hypothetical protein [Nocardia brasiliensis]|uniref:hypothetical protein n=1 Tax=Nocardia brasiliensis TaxID=37326 RepID=UPI0024573E39|nr:hypothetical protein [Nocardia brasiliensis]
MALLLWDHTITARADEIQQMSRAELADLSIGVVEGTTGLFAAPFDEYFPPDLATVITSALHRCRASAPGWRLPRGYLTHFADAVEAGLTVPLRPGCGALTMAALNLVNGVTGELDANGAMTILSSCYLAIGHAEFPDITSCEDERRNPRCQSALALQQNLISLFSAHT